MSHAEAAFMFVCVVLAATSYTLGAIAEGITERKSAALPWSLFALILLLLGLLWPI